MMIRAIQFTLASLAVLCVSITANAQSFVEIGDAGDTLGTTQSVGAGIDEITGSTNFVVSDFFDLFEATFDSAVTLSVSSNFDSELLILDPSGFGVASDDDSGAGLDALVNLSAGSYLIGLGTNATGYLDGTNELILFNDNSTNIGDVSKFGPLIGSSDLGFADESGSYTISFSSSTVPEPSLTFLGIGACVAFIGGARRRRAIAC